MNRRQISDIFPAAEKPGSQYVDQPLFSVGGTPSARRNRLRQSSTNVFPSGTMGTIDDYVEKEPENMEMQKPEMHFPELPPQEVVVPRIYLDEHDDNVDLPPITKLNTPKRNPLTGEGMVSSDMPRLYSKRKLEKTKFNY